MNKSNVIPRVIIWLYFISIILLVLMFILGVSLYFTPVTTTGIGKGLFDALAQAIAQGIIEYASFWIVVEAALLLALKYKSKWLRFSFMSILIKATPVLPFLLLVALRLFHKI